MYSQKNRMDPSTNPTFSGRLVTLHQLSNNDKLRSKFIAYYRCWVRDLLDKIEKCPDYKLKVNEQLWLDIKEYVETKLLHYYGHFSDLKSHFMIAIQLEQKFDFVGSQKSKRQYEETPSQIKRARRRKHKRMKFVDDLISISPQQSLDNNDLDYNFERENHLIIDENYDETKMTNEMKNHQYSNFDIFNAIYDHDYCLIHKYIDKSSFKKKGISINNAQTNHKANNTVDNMEIVSSETIEVDGIDNDVIEIIDPVNFQKNINSKEFEEKSKESYLRFFKEAHSALKNNEYERLINFGKLLNKQRISTKCKEDILITNALDMVLLFASEEDQFYQFAHRLAHSTELQHHMNELFPSFVSNEVEVEVINLPSNKYTPKTKWLSTMFNTSENVS